MDPWGVDDPPADVDVPPLPPRLAYLAEIAAGGVPVEVDDSSKFGAGDLPEVQALRRSGWAALDPAPLYCLLPAAWPPALRTWIPDRLPRVGIGATTGDMRPRAMPYDDDADLWAQSSARAAGLPAPPTGRIWLLRSPWPAIPVAALYRLFCGRLPDREDEIADLHRIAADTLRWSPDEAWAALPARTRSLLAAWADAGRSGDSVADLLVERHVTPDLLAEARRRTGLDEAGVLAWVAAFVVDELDEKMIDVIASWQAAGLPSVPPHDVGGYVDRDPAELRSWVDTGFDLRAARLLERAGLDRAIEWRAAGFDAADTYALLRADPALDPDEAIAFGDLPRRREWIELGFSAAEAIAWSTAGLDPFSARLWRAGGHTPGEVDRRAPRRVHLPPELHTDGYVLGVTGTGDITSSPWDDVPDPPGTRGRRARRRAGDSDPWINDD